MTSRSRFKSYADISGIFTIDEHDFFHDHGSEDLHSTQITKAIVDNYYLDMRLYRYDQHYTESVLKSNTLGVRQQPNKLVLFQGL